MAAERHGGASEFDMSQHQQTWSGFCKLLLYSVIAIAVVLLLMAYFLT
ncbi:MAG: aa3-type cytochrome c oxidase subunit IV [Alphaproteobacteria bacterium]|nr:aa3-type cytochrome c oxidase subunit IV [Alphaproteobacteria bacterium]